MRKAVNSLYLNLVIPIKNACDTDVCDTAIPTVDLELDVQGLSACTPLNSQFLCCALLVHVHIRP